MHPHRETRLKPHALTRMYRTSEIAFDLLKGAFLWNVDEYTLRLDQVDSVSLEDLKEPRDVAAIALRKLQSLRWNSQPEVYTRSDVVVALCGDLEMSMDQLCERVHEELIDPVGGGEQASVEEWLAAMDVVRHEIGACMTVVGELGAHSILLIGSEDDEVEDNSTK